MPHLRTPSVLIVLASLPLPGLEGMRLVGNGAAQTGVAGAGIASPQDSTWLTINAAALVAIPERVDAAVETLFAHSSMDPSGAIGNTASGTLDSSVVVAVPTVTYARPLAGGSCLGVGVYAVAGLALAYPDSRNVVAAAAGAYDRRIESSVLRASLAYARTLVAGWSAGLALNLNYAQLRTDSSTATLAETDGDFARDQAFGSGFQLSLFKRFTTVGLGISYTSRQWMQEFHRYDDVLIGSVDQPQILQIGVAWRPLPWFEPLIDYRFIDWDGVAVFGEDDGFGWRDQHVFKVGANLHPHPEVILRFGYSYGRSPIDASVAFLNGLTPLISESHLSAGLAWQATSHLVIEAAYLHAFANAITDNGDDVLGLGDQSRIALEVDSLVVGTGWVF